MASFRRRNGESALEWVARLRFAGPFALTAADQNDLHAQRVLAAGAADAEQRAALAPTAVESEALHRCKAAVEALTPADRRALLSWLQARL